MSILLLATRNVVRKKERSYLTIIGVLLAVASSISLLSLSEGLKKQVNQEFAYRNVHLYVIAKGYIPLPTGPIGVSGTATEILPDDLFKKMQEMAKDKDSGITNVAGVTKIFLNYQEKVLIVLGIDAKNITTFIPNFGLRQGNIYDDDDKYSELILGNKLAIKEKLEVNRSILLGNKTFTITGIRNPVNNFEDYYCYTSLNKAISLQPKQGIQEIWVQTSPRVSKELVIAEIKKLPYANIEVLTKDNYVNKANNMIRIAYLLQLAIAAIGILISITASMNTMLMSTYERIREFGTLRAIGASRNSIFLLVLLESIMLSTIGGILGIAIGYFGATVFDQAISTLFQNSFPISQVTPELIIYAVLLTLGVGAVGALIPAFIAARMNVVDALRWE